ncbi:MAG: hypothetical protein ACM3RX_02840 [Methanococcaceae archaeon]
MTTLIWLYPVVINNKPWKTQKNNGDGNVADLPQTAVDRFTQFQENGLCGFV